MRKFTKNREIQNNVKSIGLSAPMLFIISILKARIVYKSTRRLQIM